MHNIIAFILLSIVTVLEVFAYLPQIIQLIKTKSADDLSLASWFTWLFSDVCYLVYVLMESPEFGVVFMASLSLSLVLIVYILTIYYQKRSRNMRQK